MDPYRTAATRPGAAAAQRAARLEIFDLWLFAAGVFRVTQLFVRGENWGVEATLGLGMCSYAAYRLLVTGLASLGPRARAAIGKER